MSVFVIIFFIFKWESYFFGKFYVNKSVFSLVICTFNDRQCLQKHTKQRNKKKNRKLNLAKLNPCMLHTLWILKALQSFILPRAHTKKRFWVKKTNKPILLFYSKYSCCKYFGCKICIGDHPWVHPAVFHGHIF